MTSLNVSLPEAMKKFIETEVKRGGYSTPSEYVRALVRAEQKRLAEDHLEQLLVEGIESGAATEMTRKDWTAIRQRFLRGKALRKK